MTEAQLGPVHTQPPTIAQLLVHELPYDAAAALRECGGLEQRHAAPRVAAVTRSDLRAQRQVWADCEPESVRQVQAKT